MNELIEAFARHFSAKDLENKRYMLHALKSFIAPESWSEIEGIRLQALLTKDASTLCGKTVTSISIN